MNRQQPPLRPREDGGKRQRLTSVQRPEQGRGETDSAVTFGETFRTPRSGFIRILSQNIDGMGFSAHSDKFIKLKYSCDKYGIDIVTLSETNVNWKKVRPAQTLRGRTQFWKEDIRTIAGHNITAPQAPRHQYGGTAIISMNKAAHCFYKGDHDFRKLGRWTSMTYRGKRGKITRVVSCYCPVKPSEFHAGSVYTQHVEALQKVGIHTCPREQFWIDLISAIDEWQANDETLIITGDFNHHIRQCIAKLAGKGLVEVITDAHGLDNAPPTHHAGSVPIDGIFVSESIKSHVRGGYFAFGQITTSDHRALCIELPLEIFIGYNLHDFLRPNARRLKLHDPRVVKRYLKKLHSLFTYHKVYEKLAELASSITYPMTIEMQEAYESLDRIRTQCMVAAERVCRKLCMGAVPYSAAYKTARDNIDFWTCVKRRQQGLLCDTKRMLRLMKRLDIDDRHHPSM